MDKTVAAEISKAGKEVNAKAREHGCGRMSRLCNCRATTRTRQRSIAVPGKYAAWPEK